MTEPSNEQEVDESLLALVRPSNVPNAQSVAPNTTLTNNADKIDLRALANSLPPAETPTQSTFIAAPAILPEETKPMVTHVAPQAPVQQAPVAVSTSGSAQSPAKTATSSKAGLFVGIGAAVLVGAAFAFSQLSKAPEPAVAAEPTTVVAQNETVIAKPIVEAQAAPKAAEPTPSTTLPSTTTTSNTANPQQARTGTSSAVVPTSTQPASATQQPTTAESSTTASPANTVRLSNDELVGSTAPATPTPSNTRALDDMLDQALGTTRPTPNTETPKPAAPTADQNLPERPTNSEVSRVLNAKIPQVRRCAGEVYGTATARITISGDGTVSSVTISGAPYASTPAATCMEGVLKTAKFSKFRSSTFPVTYPFPIRPPVAQ